MLFFEDVFDWLKVNYESIQTDLPGSVPGVAQNCSLQLHQPIGYAPAILINFDNYRVTFVAPFAESGTVSLEKVLEVTRFVDFGFTEHPVFGLFPPHYSLVHVFQMAYIESGELKMAPVESGEIEYAIEQLTDATRNLSFMLQD